MNHIILSTLFVVFAAFIPNAHADSLPVEVQDCIKWVEQKLPAACPTAKKPAHCDTIGIYLSRGKVIGFLPYSVSALKDNQCIAQKQVMFNVCVFGNYYKIQQFASWNLFKPTDMSCGSCHPSYARTGFCY